MRPINFIAEEYTRKAITADYVELQRKVEHNLLEDINLLATNVIANIAVAFIPSLQYVICQGRKYLTDSDFNIILEQAEKHMLFSKKTEKQMSNISKFYGIFENNDNIDSKVIDKKRKADITLKLVDKVVDEINNNLKKNYGATANDIFRILNKNPYSIFIFKNVIGELDSLDKLKLISILIDYQLKENVNFMKINYYQYIFSLKCFLDDNEILRFLHRLSQEIKAENKQRAIGLLELFSTDLNLLHKRDREYILEYVYKVFGDLSYSRWNQHFECIWFMRIFSSLSLYLENSKIKDRFSKLAASIVLQHSKENKRKDIYIKLFSKITENISPEDKMEVKTYVNQEINIEVVDLFYTELETFGELAY